MLSLLKKHRGLLIIGTVILGSVAFVLVKNNLNQIPPITTVVSVGEITSTVDVSGETKIDSLAPLSFPKGGTISAIFSKKGDEVATGTILATVGNTTAEAEYQLALAELSRLSAVRDELKNGLTTEERAVTSATIKSAETALSSTIRSESAKVETARRTLLSSDLVALSIDNNTNSIAPIVSGSYNCTSEGQYLIETYKSGNSSGYSYRYRGIETGTESVYTAQSGELGECGLRIQFSDDSSYANTTWIINIPNTNGSNYAINLATLEQVKALEEQNIKAAREALDLALKEVNSATAGARIESLIAANSAVAGAEANLIKAKENLRDMAIMAPFSGVIIDTDLALGQTVGTNPVIELYAPNEVSFTARIPEIDIRKITLGQIANLSFDANQNDPQTGFMSFISPVPISIDGVAYFEVTITLDQIPSWLKTGMQADVSIIIDKKSGVLTIPRRFISNTVEGDFVNLFTGENSPTILTPVTITGYGNNGLVAIEGLPEGSVIVMP